MIKGHFIRPLPIKYIQIVLEEVGKIFISFKLRSRKTAAFAVAFFALALGSRMFAPAYENKSVSAPVQGEKTVYLTFDDGPSRTTEKVLDVLDEYGVKATFFVIGREDEYEREILRRAAQAGHSIGAHSYSHRYDIIYRSSEAFMSDFEKNENYIYDTIGYFPNIMRFPGGSANSGAPKELRRRLVNEITKRGYSFFDWNAVSGDDTAVVYPPETLLRNVIKMAGESDRIIVLFHDTDLASTTPEAARLVIEYYMQKGYKFLPLTAQSEPLMFTKPDEV